MKIKVWLLSKVYTWQADRKLKRMYARQQKPVLTYQKAGE